MFMFFTRSLRTQRPLKLVGTPLYFESIRYRLEQVAK